MKIVHTADWHLGHRLHEQSQVEEQTLFLTWLEHFIVENEIDLLLIAGDIFDTGAPSSQSLKMYYDFLVKLTKTSCKHVIVTGGNHDSPGTLNAPKALLDALSIKVVGKSTGAVDQEVFKLSVNDESVIIAAVPYLRDQDIRRAVEGETFDELTDRYKKALVNHYNETISYCTKLQDDHTPLIAMGHLFAVGGTISDSEQNIYVGTLGHIGADDFPATFDYVALGHLHRAQTVGKKEHIRYSGSPVILSFSELNHTKKVTVISTNNNQVTQIEEVAVPTFRPILSVKGKLEECISQLHSIETNSYGLTPWIEVVLDNDINTTMGYADVHKAAEGLDVEVLKVTLKNQRDTVGLDQLTENTKQIKELSPRAVFEMKCKEQGFAISENPEIMDAFNEALQIAQKN